MNQVRRNMMSVAIYVLLVAAAFTTFMIYRCYTKASLFCKEHAEPEWCLKYKYANAVHECLPVSLVASFLFLCALIPALIIAQSEYAHGAKHGEVYINVTIYMAALLALFPLAQHIFG